MRMDAETVIREANPVKLIMFINQIHRRKIEKLLDGTGLHRAQHRMLMTLSDCPVTSQGVSAAVGMALGGKMTDEKFRVYSLLGDGEIQEGQVWEAAMFAGFHKLDNLVLIVDNNGLQIDGKIEDVCSPYPIDEKFRAFKFHVIDVADGNDMEQLRQAFAEARSTKGMPTAIIAHTVKGKGVSFMEDQAGWHGKAPNDEEYQIAMADLERIGEALCQK